MLTEALEYPRRRDDWLKTVLIGGVLALFSFLIVPGILLAGYVVRVLRGTMHGDATPPAFEDWGGLLGDGLRAAVIGIVYGVLPSLVFLVMAVAGGLLSFGGGGVGDGLGLLTVLLGGLVALVVGLAVAYVLPAALANFVETGRIGAAFSWSELRPVLFNGAYATAWATAFVLVFAAGVVTTVLNLVPLLGFVVGSFVGFYAAVAAYYVIGRAWAELHTVPPAGMDAPEKSPAI